MSHISIEIGNVIIASIIILCALVLVILLKRIAGIIAESASIRLDAAALVTGELMPSEKKKRIIRVKKRMSGLRFKLFSFTVGLALAVNTMAAVPLYVLMTRSHEQTLFQGLLDRSTVLLEGLAANAHTLFLQGNVAGMGNLPNQMISVPEAMYVTITGYNPETRIFADQVWATNDVNILRKIDTFELLPGYSHISDELTEHFHLLYDELNNMARDRTGGFSRNIHAVEQEILLLTEQIRSNPSPELVQQLEGQQMTLSIFEQRLTEELDRIGRVIRSEPDYSAENFRDRGRFLFYKPIMLHIDSDEIFFWGLIRLEVSINSILHEIAEERETLFRLNVFILLFTQLIGSAGALVLSNVIIRPIRQLVRHVEIIRDTHDKARLSGLDIKLKSRDELAILGNTINDMTHGLVEAAFAASDLSVGKEIQKKFLPLALDASGEKLSSAFEETQYLDLFGYYEGAKGVSGDYFDFQDLDGRYYAVIKCDVAGKGIPASFIMILVATMFKNYCKLWKLAERGMRIEDLVYQMNEFIEALAFKDRFAAFTFCLYDSYTGVARFCNAGDNLIHIYDASEKRLKTLTLPETPAAGVLPNQMVESKGGYRAQTVILDHGDILLLFTDGIEESQRKFRNSDFEEILCTEGPDDTPHGNHASGQGIEDMGFERVKDIINTIMNNKVYTLNKWHNGEGEDQDLHFDFRSSKGTVEEVIMAIISVEKMFRCYYDPKASDENRVLVDSIVDAFLKTHFVQYRDYCSFTLENPVNKAYMYYTHVMEDEQYDDLTILGIKRK